MAIQKFHNNYKLLSADEKIATWSTLVSFLGVAITFVSLILPKNDSSLTDATIPEMPVVVDSKNRSSYRNEITPSDILQILEGYSTDSSRLSYLNSVKDDISANFDRDSLLELISMMETDVSKLHALRIVEDRTDMLFPGDVKEILQNFDNDTSMNSAHKIIRNINETTLHR